MAYLRVNKFGGLQQKVEPDQRMQNLDVDDPVGRLRVRDGYSKLNDNADNSEFTNLISWFEYRFDVSSQTYLIVNDNGTLKVSSNSGNSWSDLTLPGGSALESGFKNQYFGWRDHVLITTGNGSTNHVLWYGYVDRGSGNGIFNNDLTKEANVLTRAQLITPHGNFSLINSIVYLDGYYYVSYSTSKWIEKRNTSFLLVERWAINEDEGVTAADNGSVVLSANTSTGKLYAGTTGGVYQIDPYTHEMDGSDTTITNVLGVCHDGKHVYSINASTVCKTLISTFANVTSNTSGITAATSISCDDTQDSGNIYIGDVAAGPTPTIRQRLKSDISTDVVGETYDLTDVDAGMTTVQKIEYYDADQVYVLAADVTNQQFYIVDLDSSGVSTKNAHYTASGFTFNSFVWVSGTTLRVISGNHGLVKHLDAATIVYPEFMTIANTESTNTGDLQAGTYFYKICAEDVNGQYYTLSDPLIVPISANDKQIGLRVVATGDRSETEKFIEFYRLKNIHIYRGYDTGTDAKVPGTDYKLLETIDINDGGWVEDTINVLYYYDYIDNQTESEISSVTFFESSGIGDAVKPRYLNGKYFAFLDKQLYMANYYYDGDTYRYRVAVSPIDNPDSITDYDTFRYDAGGGEAIKDIVNAFGRMVIFKKRTMGVFYNQNLEIEFDVGLFCDKAFVKVNENVYFVSNDGIYIFNGTDAIKISDPVDYYWDNKGSYDDWAVFNFSNKQRIIFSYCQSGGQGECSFVYNYAHNLWMYYSGNFAFRGYLKTYTNVYMGCTRNTIYELFDGSTKDDEDEGGGNGTAIICYYEQPHLLFDDIEGEMATLISMRNRYKKNDNDTLSVKIYEYSDAGKTLRQTLTPDDTGGYIATISNLLSSLLGESFSVRMEITTPSSTTNDDAVFEHHGYTIEYEGGGYNEQL